LISVDTLVTIAEEIGGVKLRRKYDLSAPRGVAGRNSDNTFIKQIFGWEPSTPFREGLSKTYNWIEGQYFARKAGERIVEDTM
jgi:nucleoside-diphosphate-sugar epimerase